MKPPLYAHQCEGPIQYIYLEEIHNHVGIPFPLHTS